MKILNIKFKNLNSLKGEWFIDLTHNIYISEGIFAITGPTGAGKTTIFDAVCLALYGRTPRLGRLGGQSNEIMTRRTRECYAQVEFESDGKKYKCLWSQKKEGKKLQSVKHILSEAREGGKIFSELTRDTVPNVEDLTGLDFKRFTQAMMLEQGRFDAFLKANSTERSEILELITGTEIYSGISTRVYERCQAERDKREKLLLRLDEKKPNDSFGSDSEIQNNLAQNKKMLDLIERKHKDTQADVLRLKEIAKLRAELAQNQSDIETQHKRSELFAPDRQKLESGLKAQELMPEHAALEAKRNEFKTCKTRCDKNESEITAFTERVTQITNNEIPNCESKLKQVRRDITESPETICERVMSLVKTFEDAYTRKKNLEDLKAKLESELAKAQAVMKAAQSEAAKAHALHEQAINELSELTNTRTELIIDGLRKTLKHGRPCPVCGSLEHPDAGKHSKFAGIDINEKFKELKTRENYAHKKYNESNSKLMQAASYESRIRADLDNCIKELGQAVETFADSRTAVSEAIAPLGIYDAKTKSEILSRVNQWSSNVKNLEQYLERLTKESDLLQSRIQAISKTLSDEKITLERLTAELDSLEKTFQASLIDKNFQSEQDFNNAKLSPDVLAKLQAGAQAIDDRIKQLEAVKLNLTQKLDSKLAENINITESNLDELEELFKTQEDSIKEIMKRNAELESALETRKKIREEYQALKTEFQAQDKIYSEWAGLNDLIGTKNGSKFRNFAQKVTLSMMIALANKQLEKLSERYELTATPDDSGLALSVIDHEQAGEIRPTANLSGGERFIVSLALALGLSQISGSKARVDSLFLDEGFGSLDEDSLNTALEALSEVRREGRMIGIISHVQALKERIRAQINVIPKSEGISIIEGAGCKSL
ncbi:MAG: AAA family ATPase [Synergistaceae bacterium]|nr:AAA family ATPase [Synergistaceae bacterium]